MTWSVGSLGDLQENNPKQRNKPKGRNCYQMVKHWQVLTFILMSCSDMTRRVFLNQDIPEIFVLFNLLIIIQETADTGCCS